MTIDFSEKGKVIISMFDYVEDTVQDLPEFLQSTHNVSTPAADHLFKVNNCTKKKLTEDLSKVFLSLRDKTTVPIKMCTARHADCSGFSMHTCQSTRRG